MRRHIFPWVFNFKKNISVRLNITGKINTEKIANGSSYEGNFVDGRYNGKGIYFNPEKNETYKGTFRDGKINGSAVQRRADGSVTEGHWEDDKFIVDNTESGHSGAAPEQKAAPSSASKHPVQQQRRRTSTDGQNAQSGTDTAGQDNADFLTDTGCPANESCSTDKNCPADESYAVDEVYADNAGGSFHNSVSEAAFAAGYSISGPQQWKTVDGTTLKSYETNKLA